MQKSIKRIDCNDKFRYVELKQDTNPKFSLPSEIKLLRDGTFYVLFRFMKVQGIVYGRSAVEACEKFRDELYYDYGIDEKSWEFDFYMQAINALGVNDFEETASGFDVLQLNLFGIL